jgi:uncharacterized RDD family membrane protein YckC
MKAGSGFGRRARKTTGVILTAAGAILVGFAVLMGKASFQGGGKIEGAGIAGVIAVVSGLLGVWLYRLGRRLKAQSAQEILTNDPRPPVLYLRSFAADSKAAGRIESGMENFMYGVSAFHGLATEEEQLAMVVDRVGPLLAVGRPGELLPLLGAGRFYVTDNDWQEKVRDLIRSSALVVLRVGSTDGFWWEVSTCAREGNPERLVFLLPTKEKFYEAFRQRAADYLPRPLPDFPKSGVFSSPRGSIGAVLWFDRDWTPRIAPVGVGMSTFMGHPVAVELAQALGPLLRRAGGIEYEVAPLAPRCGAAIVDLIVVALLSIATYLVIRQVWSDPPTLVPAVIVGSVATIGLYFFGFEMSPWRGTPGKRAFNLEVRDRCGVPMNWGQTLCRLGLTPLLIIFWPLWPVSLILVMRRRPTIGDKITHSAVFLSIQPALITGPTPLNANAKEIISVAEPTRAVDKVDAVLTVLEGYRRRLSLIGNICVAVLIAAACMLYEYPQLWVYTIGSVLVVFLALGFRIGAIEKAGVARLTMEIAERGLNDDEKTAFVSRLAALKEKDKSDNLIDPILAELKG